QRFLQSHRWRDALLASLACSLQILTNAYSLLASLSIAFPILAWMISQNPPTRRHIFPGIAALAITMGSALLMVWPYISVAGSGETLHAQMHIWAPWSAFVGQEWLIPAAGQLVESGVPSQFPGALSIMLIAAAILLPRGARSFVGFSGDPRWALLTSGLLVLLLATGGNEVARSHAAELGHTPPPALPNLYEWLAGIVPGLESIRVIGFLYPGFHLIVCLLAGLGASKLLDRAPKKRRRIAGLALILITFGLTVRSPVMAPSPDAEMTIFEAGPSPTDLQFFAELEAEGNEGPILILPPRRRLEMHETSIETLLTVYHHRPISSCNTSFVPPEESLVLKLAEGLPRRKALQNLRQLGFTTIVIRHSDNKNERAIDWSQRVKRAAIKHPRLLAPVLETPSLSAYRLVPPH
ncbi:hypothetical protein MK280_00775, partial [Myxococcota bacterium]|nr:hypothetical protein [Myxococcota bacterium]